MNIKSVSVANVLPQDPKKRVEGEMRTKGSADRDANGRREEKEPEIKQHLTESEFEEALKVLGELPGVKSSNFVIRVEVKDSVRTVYIEDLNGKIIRRLSESQLWLATRDKNKQTGAFFDKAM